MRECDRWDVGGVAIELDERPTDGLALLSELQKVYPELPIAVICDLPLLKLPPRVVRLSNVADAAPMLDALLQFCVKSCRFCITGKLTVAALTLSLDDQRWTYMKKPLKLTAAQHRVLYALFYYAPRQLPLVDLVLLCGYGSKSGGAEVRKVIRDINQAAAKISPEPLIQCAGVGNPTVSLAL